MARRESSGNRTRYPGVKNLGGGEFLIRAVRRDHASGMRRQKERTVKASSVADAFDQRRALEKELNGEVSPMSLSAREETRVPDRDLRLVVGSSKRPSANGAGTLGELAKDWLKRRLAEQRKDGRARLVTSTRGRYVNCVEQVIVPMLGEWRIDQLDHQGIERWRDHLAKRYASASVNGQLRVLRAILRDAGIDVASRVRSLEEDDTRITEDSPNLLETEQDVTRFLDLFRESFPQHYPLVGLLVTTGMRIGTALALQRSDFEPERGIVVARRRLSRNEVIEGVKRGRTARDTLPLVDWVWAAIEAEWKDHNKAQRESGLAFPTAAGGYRARSCLMKPFAEACQWPPRSA